MPHPSGQQCWERYVIPIYSHFSGEEIEANSCPGAEPISCLKAKPMPSTRECPDVSRLSWASVGGRGQIDAVSRSWGRPRPGSLVRTRDGSVLTRSTPHPCPAVWTASKERSVRGRGFQAHGGSLCTSQRPVWTPAPDRGDKFLPPFGHEKYPQFKLGQRAGDHS